MTVQQKQNPISSTLEEPPFKQRPEMICRVIDSFKSDQILSNTHTAPVDDAIYPKYLDTELDLKSLSDSADPTPESSSPSSSTSSTSTNTLDSLSSLSDEDNATTVGKFAQVYDLLLQTFPSWSTVARELIEIKQLTGGITNMLLKATNHASEPAFSVLVRTYGNGTSTIINRENELTTHLNLFSHGLAPSLYAKFTNGLIYRYTPGRTLHYSELSEKGLSKAIAGRLAMWHNVVDLSKVQFEETDFSFWAVLYKWIAVLPDTTPTEIEWKTRLRNEVDWVKRNIGDKGGKSVFAHCDLLAGNILDITSSGDEEGKENRALCNGQGMETTNENNIAYKPTAEHVSFIDYEYSTPSPRAFDVANHFMEWQGFDCKKELIPNLTSPEGVNVVKTWIKHYLAASKFYQQKSSELNDNIIPSSTEIDDMVEELKAWWGMPGFYWGIWASIQAEISEIDFDYASYAKERLDEYWVWKAQWIANN